MTVSKLPPDLIDDLLSDYKKPEDLLGENGILKQLTRAVVERLKQRWSTTLAMVGMSQLAMQPETPAMAIAAKH
jgi:hypothetical protein